MKTGNVVSSRKLVRLAVREREDLVVKSMVMAFSADPVARWLYPESGQYGRDFTEFVHLFGGRAFAEGTAHEVGDCEGVAMWLPPGISPDEEAFTAFLERSLGAAVREDAFRVLEQMNASHPHEEHWYLPMIGVVPERQGYGLGTMLLEYALARCDRTGMPAYLESSNAANIPLYERFGFEVIGEIQAGSSPTLYPMLRSGGIC